MIQVEGVGLERFLNRALGDGVLLWNVRRPSRTRMTMEMRSRDFLTKLPAVRRKYRCRVKILARRGMPFVLARFRRRKVLLIGCLLCGLGLLFASTRILFIKTEGTYRVPEAVILRAVAEAGVFPGMDRGKVENAALSRAVRAYDRRIAWAGVEKRGVTLVIEVAEAEPLPEQIKAETPADVVAAKDGIVERITALMGKPAVKPGDAVRKGDVLIRGDITREGAEMPLRVHAAGTVSAEVWYEGRATLPATQSVLVPTGQEAPYRALYVAGLKVWETPPAFGQGRLVLEERAEVTGLVLPIRQMRGRWLEEHVAEIPADVAENLAEAAFRAELAALALLPKSAVVEEKKVVTRMEPDGRVTGIAEIRVLEEISQSAPLG